MFSLVSFSIGPCADRRGKHVAGWPWDSILCGRRLQKEANKHRAVAAAAAQDASAVKRARFEATVDAAQLARFQAALGRRSPLWHGRPISCSLARLLPLK